MSMDTQPRTKNRGFASMDEHRQREIARKGGRAAHEKGKAHEFTPDEARAAGRKGGEKVSVNRKHMAEIGRRGGRSSAQRRRPSDETELSSQTQQSASMPAEHASMRPQGMADLNAGQAGMGSEE
jgi:general stress protein YciG